MPRVLIVNNEPGMRVLLRTSYSDAGFVVYEAGNTQRAAELLQGGVPDLLVLDGLLPGDSAIRFLNSLRTTAGTAGVQVMMLSAKSTVEDRVNALNAGADDCLSRPFSAHELLSRSRALLRRSSHVAAQDRIACDDLVLDPVRVQVFVDGQKIHLTPTEYALLYLFMTNQERAITRAELGQTIWGRKPRPAERTIDVHVGRLRLALAPYGYDRLIQTVLSVGYRFSPQMD